MDTSDYTAHFLNRLFSAIQIPSNPDQCFIWVGEKTYNGYGEIRCRGKHLRAHRVMYGLYYGVEPGNKSVCHTCDNPACCNPKHLWLGTHQENMQDMVRKGRHPRIRQIRDRKGKVNPLTAEQILDIQALWKMTITSYEELAVDYNVSAKVIKRALNHLN